MVTRYHDELTLPHRLQRVPLGDAFSYVTSHPQFSMLSFWGLILPLSFWLLFPLGFFMGTVGAMVETAMYDSVTPADSPNQVRLTAVNSGHPANIAVRVVIAALLAYIPYSVISTVPLVIFAFFMPETGSTGSHFLIAFLAWTSFFSLCYFLILPGGLVRVVRTTSISAVLSPRTFAAIASTSYLKAMFVTSVVLVGYSLLLPFTFIIPFLGLLFWGAGLAIVLAALSIYIATRTPGLPNEFTTGDGPVQRDIQSVGEPTPQQ